MIVGLFGIEAYSYHQTIRNYVVLFGSIFSNMHIKRGDKFIKVPIKYGKGTMYEKAPQGVQEREKSKLRMIVPSMAFLDDDIARDPVRQTSTSYAVELAQGFEAAARIPYNISFKLHTRNKNIEDHLQMLEQITSVFDPTVTVKMKPTKESEKYDNILIKLESFSTDDNSEEQDEERLIECEYSFTLEGYIYKKTSKKPIVTEVVWNIGVEGATLGNTIFVSDETGKAEMTDVNGLSDLIEKGLVLTVPTGNAKKQTTVKTSPRKKVKPS